MKYLKHCVLILIVLLVPKLQAQTTDVWVFGGGYKVDFNKSPLQLNVLENLPYNSCGSSEGEVSAVQCDSLGNLQYFFLSDRIFDNELDTATNSTGIESSCTNTKGALFVPYPNSDSLLLLTTSSGYPSGDLFETVVYNGAVVRKNNVVDTNVIEGITAVPHQNGIDFWVLSHSADSASSDFNSFLVTANGLTKQPVVSSIGIENSCLTGVCGGVQAIEVNACGNKIAYLYLSTIQIFDFDNSTGTVSNLQKTILAFKDSANESGTNHFYGLEFSPNGNFLYCTQPVVKSVFQIDLTDPRDSLHIDEIDTIASNVAGVRVGEIEIAPNGKMYVVHHYWGPYYGGAVLSSINFPDQKGAGCGFEENVFADNSGSLRINSQMGLPNYIKSFVYNSSVEVIHQCVNGGLALVASRFGGSMPENDLEWTVDGGSPFQAGDSIFLSTLTAGSHEVALKYTSVCGDVKVINYSFTTLESSSEFNIDVNCLNNVSTVNLLGGDTANANWFNVSNDEYLGRGANLLLTDQSIDSILVTFYDTSMAVTGGLGALYSPSEIDTTSFELFTKSTLLSFQVQSSWYLNSENIVMKVLDQGDNVVFHDTVIVGSEELKTVSVNAILETGKYRLIGEGAKLLPVNTQISNALNSHAYAATEGSFFNLTFGAHLYAGCVNDTILVIDTCMLTSALQNTVVDKIRLYPNPADEVVYFEKSTKDENCRVVIHDAKGVPVYTRSFIQLQGPAKIDVSSFAPGVYTFNCTVKDSGITIVKKLVVK
ncbi:MAG: hypothetical protein ACJAZ2_002340 [Glaciecola sp.]|jgi:hypothetical protein